MTALPLAGELARLRARGINPRLDALQAALAAPGNPHHDFRSILVAGTNGKGSVVFYLDAILRAHGRRTARYISPELSRFTERLAIDGAELPLARWEAVHRQVREHPGSDHVLTEFEYVTLLALLLAAAERVDEAVLEVGMGGRLDATNVVAPAVCVITSVGLDHCRWLGDTLEAVAGEKAGIMRPGIPCVIGDLPPDALTAVERRARALGTPLLRLADAVDLQAQLPPLRNAAPVQRTDALLALLAARTLLGDTFSAAVGMTALADVVVPARGELLERDGKRYYFDTAHNPEAAMWLCSALQQIPGDKALLCGLMRDKDAAGFFRELAGTVAVTTVTLPGERAATAADLAAAAREEGCAAQAADGDVPDVFHRWDAALPQATLRVIAGSHALVGPVYAPLR